MLGRLDHLKNLSEKVDHFRFLKEEVIFEKEIANTKTAIINLAQDSYYKSDIFNCNLFIKTIEETMLCKSDTIKNKHRKLYSKMSKEHYDSIIKSYLENDKSCIHWLSTYQTNYMDGGSLAPYIEIKDNMLWALKKIPVFVDKLARTNSLILEVCRDNICHERTDTSNVKSLENESNSIKKQIKEAEDFIQYEIEYSAR